MSSKKWDLFISHASEDKSGFVFPLVEELKKRNISVWLDSENIELGDSIRRKIEFALVKSKFALVIISQDYLQKKWTTNELDTLFSLEQPSSKLILPIAHGIDYDEIKKQLPLLADKLSINSNIGMEAVVNSIERALKNEPSVDHLYKTSYFFLDYDPHNISLDITFSKFKETTGWEMSSYEKIAKSTAKSLLPVIAKLTDLSVNDLVVSRPKELLYEIKGENDLSYDFSFITTRKSTGKWKSFSLFLHYRGWHYTRSVSDNTIYMCVTLYDEWEPDAYTEDVSSDEAQKFLSDLKPFFEEHICSVINTEPGINAKKIVFKTPFYEEEAVPVSGGNAFIFDGIITE